MIEAVSMVSIYEEGGRTDGYKRSILL